MITCHHPHGFNYGTRLQPSLCYTRRRWCHPSECRHPIVRCSCYHLCHSEAQILASCGQEGFSTCQILRGVDAYRLDIGEADADAIAVLKPA